MGRRRACRRLHAAVRRQQELPGNEHVGDSPPTSCVIGTLPPLSLSPRLSNPPSPSLLLLPSLPVPSRLGSARLCCLGCAASMGAPDTSAPAPAVPPTASSPSSMPRLLGRGLFATPFTCPPIYTPPHWCRFYCSPASERGGTTSGRQAPHQTGKKGGEGRGGERKKTPTPTTPQNKNQLTSDWGFGVIFGHNRLRSSLCL